MDIFPGGDPELVVATEASNGAAYVLDSATGAVHLELRPSGAGTGLSWDVAILDVTGDGHEDVVAAGIGPSPTDASRNGISLWAFDGASGAQVWRLQIGTMWTFGSWDPALEVGDLDRDGFPEVVVTQGHGWHAEPLGTNSGNYPRILAVDPRLGVVRWEQCMHASVGGQLDSIAIGDLDGVGTSEVIAGSRDGFLYALEPVLTESRTNAEYPVGGSGIGETPCY